MSGYYPRSNPIREAISTYAAVDGLYRADRQEAAQAEDRQFVRANQSRQMALAENQDSRAQADADYQEEERAQKRALMAAYKEEYAGENGPDAADYLDPEIRAAHRPLLAEARERIQAGDLSEEFALPYLNNIYKRQVAKGSGGISKELAKVGLSPDGKSLIAGVKVGQEDGSFVNKMVTEQRLSLAEGDNKVKMIPIADLVKDNFMRQILIDEFDKAGVDGSDKKAVKNAEREVLRKFAALGDTGAMERLRSMQRGDRLQAIVDQLPTDASPEEKKRALYLSAKREGLSEQEIKPIADTLDVKEKEYGTYDDGTGITYAYDKTNPKAAIRMPGSAKPVTNVDANGNPIVKGSGKSDLITLKTGRQVTLDDLRQGYIAAFGKPDGKGGIIMDANPKQTFDEWANGQAVEPIFTESVDMQALDLEADAEAREWADANENDWTPFNSKTSTEIAAKKKELLVAKVAAEQARIATPRKEAVAITGKVVTTKTLDKATALTILKEAGGDKARARQLATQRGYAL